MQNDKPATKVITGLVRFSYAHFFNGMIADYELAVNPEKQFRVNTHFQVI